MPSKPGAFQKELQSLINRYSKENESDTPDFVLADYIGDCLLAFGSAVRRRDMWHAKQAERAHRAVDPEPHAADAD